MKLVLFLSFVLILPFIGCQRDKMNSKNLTTVNVKRNLPASLSGNTVSLDTIRQKPSRDNNNTTIASNRKATRNGTKHQENKYKKLSYHRGQPSPGKSSRKRRDTTKSQRLPERTDHYQRPALSCQYRKLHG